MNFINLIEQMTLDDKVALCSGADFWRTKAFKKYGIPSIMFSDGPNGLRKQENSSDHIGINQSKPATCFPAACAIGNSWDTKLAKAVGAAIAEEALQEGVSVVLGPGTNIKRNPLCGRNFEYFSEDPYISGELAAAFIEGAESLGVGTSLKHFAANNQETNRFSCDSVIDERTLREIYLAAFETAVKKGNPSTVMCAYNKVNGTYCSDNQYLLRDILRDEWGFTGVIVTDWGAMNDRIAAFKAGTDLGMPGGANYFDQDVIESIRLERLSEEQLNESIDRLLTLIFKAERTKQSAYRFDVQKHHFLARDAAAQSAVLLKNSERILPLQRTQKISVIGSFAKKIRYQGSGSSHINPTQLTNVLDVLDDESIEYAFYEGCHEDGSTNDALIEAAVQGARASEIAVIFAGLTDIYESEGFDRESLSMPEGHNRMIQEIAKVNPNTVVVLMGGSPVTMPWLDKVKALLHMYLPGQAGGLAVVDLLYGKVNPSGKLAETYPLSYQDVPSAGFYEKGGHQAQYREGIYVGYRYYDTAGIDVCFPFGFGLSYTAFNYSQLNVSKHDENVDVALAIKNTGNVAGAEIVQLYIHDLQRDIHRPDKELKGFQKVFLKPGEEKKITFSLDKRSFAFYDVNTRNWEVTSGTYDILIGASSRDIRFNQNVQLQGKKPSGQLSLLTGSWYEHLRGKPQVSDLEMLLGYQVKEPDTPIKGSYTMEHSIMDMRHSFIMRFMYKMIEKTNGKANGGIDYNNPAFRLSMISSTNIPMKNLCTISSGQMQRNIAEGLVHMANGRYLKGILSMLQKR